MRKLIISAAAGLAALLPVAASAERSAYYIVSIPVHDLDLTSPRGASELRHRAVTSARKVCGGGPRSVGEARVASKCRANFRNRVEDRIALASARSTRQLAGR